MINQIAETSKKKLLCRRMAEGDLCEEGECNRKASDMKGTPSNQRSGGKGKRGEARAG